MAEGKLMYHCSLALRLMSWTLVGKPMREVSFRSISSCITRYHEHDRITTWNIKNALLCLLSSQWPKPSRQFTGVPESHSVPNGIQPTGDPRRQRQCRCRKGHSEQAPAQIPRRDCGNAPTSNRDG